MMLMMIVLIIIMILLQQVSSPSVCDKQLFHLTSECDKFEIWRE